MSSPIVTINFVVLNGEKYVRQCLDAVLAQTYPRENIECNILDNGSTDKTKDIIAAYPFDKLRVLSLSKDNQQLTTNNFPKFFLLEGKKNLGVWPGQEELLKYTNGKYIVALCVDVMLDKDFVKNAIEVLERDEKLGAIQPKIYKYDASTDFRDSRFVVPDSKIIDTAGFTIFRSRRVINIGHGETDTGPLDKARGKQFDFHKEQEIFAVEGAAPVFRKEALESCRINIPYPIFHTPYSEIVDHDYFWYGDDLDLAWRMRLFGWKQIFAPSVIAWHDRQTTKSVKKTWLDHFRRVPVRRQIPIKKRRLDWRNTRWTLVKNDHIINILKDLPWVIAREISVLGYAVLFEPQVLKEIPTFFKYLPKMLRKRREIMKRAVTTPGEIRKWTR